MEDQQKANELQTRLQLMMDELEKNKSAMEDL